MMKKAQVRISPLWLVFGCFGKRHLRGTAGGGDVSFWIRCASMCFFLLLHVAASGACRGHPVALTAHQVSVADSHWVWDTPEVACPDWPTCILERCFPTCNCGQALGGVTQQTSLPSTLSPMRSEFQLFCPFLGYSPLALVYVLPFYS